MENQIELKFKDIDGRKDSKIVEFCGDLDATNVENVLESVMSLLSEGVINIIADFEKLRYVNSTGLGILLHFSKVASEKSGRFVLVNINENVYEIIEIIGANSLLEIYNSLDEGLASLK